VATITIGVAEGASRLETLFSTFLPNKLRMRSNTLTVRCSVKHIVIVQEEPSHIRLGSSFVSNERMTDRYYRSSMQPMNFPVG
jgi:hypothetical protein